MIQGTPRYINLKAGISKEDDGDKIIVGINNVDAYIKEHRSNPE